jgi:hypothetical protein
VIGEVDVWEEAPLPSEPLEPAEDEVRTTTLHVRLDVVLVDRQDVRRTA